MNLAATSKEKILEISRQMIMEKGIPAINMRVIASECGVAVGSIYNYYPSKSDLVNATIESVWKDIFHGTLKNHEFNSFVDCISWLFETIRDGGKQYPEFFTIHSLNFASEDKQKGRQMMNKSFETLKKKLLLSLANDQKVRKDVFQGEFTPHVFVDYIFTLLITILLDKQPNCDTLLLFIKSCIY